MKKLFVLLLLATVLSWTCAFAQTDSTAVFNVGGFKVTWGVIVAALAFIEAILRSLPTGKYASLLGLLHWLDNVLPNNIKTKDTPPPSDHQ